MSPCPLVLLSWDSKEEVLRWAPLVCKSCFYRSSTSTLVVLQLGNHIVRAYNLTTSNYLSLPEAEPCLRMVIFFCSKNGSKPRQPITITTELDRALSANTNLINNKLVEIRALIFTSANPDGVVTTETVSEVYNLPLRLTKIQTTWGRGHPH